VDAWHEIHLVGVGVVCYLADHPVDLITKRAVESQVKGYKKFSKVSALVHLLHKVTI
jgi:hypothetical protein